MNHLLKRGERFYFNRRVPEEFREYDSRNYIRISLKTDSRSQAILLAAVHNTRLEHYWEKLFQTGKKHGQANYEIAVSRARDLGFGYMSNDLLSSAPLNEIVTRLTLVQKDKSEHTTVAVLGGLSEPVIKLDDALALYWDYSKGKTFNKSPHQLRKWQYPRKKAIENLISVIGNKPITEITREDLLKFRDWWLNRLQRENMVANSANKNFIHIKVIIETVSDNLNLKIDIQHLFRKLVLSEDDEKKRLSFETDYIRNTLLNPENLSGLSSQAKAALYAFAETGAGISELVGLSPNDICINASISHIILRPQEKKALKTKYRKRIIPLVGYALEAFKNHPEGFTDYRDNPDRLSNELGKYLRENNLLPSDQHTVYSLRHSFQDRLLAVNAPDRVQADLMGHKFQRQSYGNGASLEQKLEWMKKIRLKHERVTF